MDYRQQQFNAKSIELTWINLYKWPLKAEVHRINLMLYMWRNRRCIIHLEFLKHSETIFCWKVPCACESENVLLFLDNAWMRTVRITQEKIHLIFLSYFIFNWPCLSWFLQFSFSTKRSHVWRSYALKPVKIYSKRVKDLSGKRQPVIPNNVWYTIE